MYRKRSKNGIWYINIRMDDGRRIQKSLGTSNSKLAKAIEGKIRAGIQEGKYFEKPEGDNITVKEMIEKFMATHALKVSSSMQASYKVSFAHIISFMGDKVITKVKPKDVANYKEARLEAGKKPATVNRELAALSKMFSIGVKEWEWLDSNPVSNVSRLKENNARTRWLSNEEEARILSNSPEWLSDLIIVSVDTGMRCGELLSLRWSEVNLFRKVLFVLMSKNKKSRTIPLSQRVLDIFVKMSKLRSLENDFVFITSNNRKRLPRNVTTAFERVLKKSNVNGFRWHDLRHTFASRLAQKNAPIFSIAELMGHSIVMATRYSHHSIESLKSVVELLNFGSPLADKTLNMGKEIK